MNERKLISFAPFLLDIENEKLWLDSKEIPLRPKTFAVLRRLMENDHQPMSVDELLQTVWPGTYVSKGVVKGCIKEIRKALRDERKTPQFIETVPRRGYRFLQAMTDTSGRRDEGPHPKVHTVKQKLSPSLAEKMLREIRERIQKSSS